MKFRILSRIIGEDADQVGQDAEEQLFLQSIQPRQRQH